MRGYYAALYLSLLVKRYAATRGVPRLDLGKGFDLISGTSTGGILACALAKGSDLEDVAALYSTYGKQIFERKIPSSAWRLPCFLLGHRSRLRRGARALEKALLHEFRSATIGDVWADRRIALAIPSVNMSHHRSWVFKTPHLAKTKHRDDEYTLVDVCLATTAAPIYRSMACLTTPGTKDHCDVFVDGGLWANAPVLVGLIDALEMAKRVEKIEVYSLGTSPPAAGDSVEADDCHRTALGWRFGADVVKVSLGAQQFATHNMARMLSRHVNPPCTVVQFPHAEVPTVLARHFDLDATDDVSMDAMRKQAHADVNETLSRCADASNNDGQLIDALLRSVPPC